MSTRPVGKARGVLRSRPADGSAFQHSRHAPASDLEPFVEHFWTVAWNLEERAPHLAETLPHPSVHIVLEQGASRVAGVCRKRFSRLLEGTGRVFGIKFLPGGFYPLLGSLHPGWPVSKLTDLTWTLPELFGPASDRVEAEVLAHEDPARMIEAASRFLRQHLPGRDPAAEDAGQIVARIASDREIGKVEDLVRLAGQSPRQLQRSFRRYIGVSPKWVIQRYRLHEALERIDNAAIPDWPRLALDLGYADQSHFIKSFKELVGRAPGEYAKGFAEVEPTRPDST